MAGNAVVVVNVLLHMGFSENIVVAETSFQMIEVLSFCNWEMVDLPSIKITVLTFLVKKKNKKNAFRGGCFFLENTGLKSRSRSRRSSLVLESKGHLCFETN